MRVLAAITDEGERVLRQVNPGKIRHGRPSSAVFEPRPADEGMLSVTRESMRAASEAYSLFCSNPRCRSAGVLAVTVGEALAETLNTHTAPMVTAEGDPIDDDAHCIIDFRQVAPDDVEVRAIGLHRAAMARGYVHEPPKT